MLGQNQKGGEETEPSKPENWIGKAYRYSHQLLEAGVASVLPRG